MKEYCIKPHKFSSESNSPSVRWLFQTFLCLPPTKTTLLFFFQITVLRAIFESFQTNISTPPFPSACEQREGCAVLVVIDGSGGGCWSLLLYTLNLKHITETVCPCLSSIFRRKVFDLCTTVIMKTKFCQCTAKISVSSGDI